jgi:uncharacterized membrane protein YbhN (UPF0104 family)
MSSPDPTAAGEGEGAREREIESAGAPGHDPSRRLRHGLIALVILVALVVGLGLAVPGLHKVGHTVVHMSGGWVAVAVALEILSCLGYVLAFLQVFDRAPIRFGARVALSELAFNAAVSLGGAGSVAVGGWLLVERGAPVGRVAERSAVLFLLTSAINVITLAAAGLGLFTGLVPGPGNPLLSLVPGLVGALVFIGFLLLPALIERRWLTRTPHKVQVTLETTAESIRDTWRLLRRPDWRLIGAIGYLWADIGALVACFAAAGRVPPLAPIVLAYQIAYLSNLIPVPGGVGVLDGSMVGMLVLYGVSAGTAAAATVVYHAISLWIPAMWGTVAFVLLRRSGKEPIQLRPPRAERRLIRRGARRGPAASG